MRQPPRRILMAATEILGDLADPRAIPPLPPPDKPPVPASATSPSAPAPAAYQLRPRTSNRSASLHDPDLWRRLDAATVLGSCRCAEVVHPLTEALQDPLPSLVPPPPPPPTPPPPARLRRPEAIARTKEALPALFCIFQYMKIVSTVSS